jgi:hypothetical protein
MTARHKNGNAHGSRGQQPGSERQPCIIDTLILFGHRSWFLAQTLYRRRHRGRHPCRQFIPKSFAQTGNAASVVLSHRDRDKSVKAPQNTAPTPIHNVPVPTKRAAYGLAGASAPSIDPK